MCYFVDVFCELEKRSKLQKTYNFRCLKDYFKIISYNWFVHNLLISLWWREVLSKETNLIWIDLEMTGLSPEEDTIIEIATIITDEQLNQIAEGPTIAIYQPDERLKSMDEWNTKHHTESGLLERVHHSVLDLGEAEKQTLAFLKKYTTRRKCPLCGNSIGQDRAFLRRYMPKLESYFHYRNIDVSSIKELVKRWYPAEMQAPTKKNAHLALDDIRESIEELRFYREHIFCPKSVK